MYHNARLLKGDQDVRRWQKKSMSAPQAALVLGRFSYPSPDPPFRVKTGIHLIFQAYDRELVYTPLSRKGDIDYPLSAETQATHCMKN
ncbi:hypothetical protein HRG_008385 [Hirsutella rhossiliensis]|uniref:Uncharacterized protein n=1 Tax=Hirsutella rhossiliensis TaxID=111463 RepID=A0A9P8SG96_9HYPO|nr:uncharacterized protein HRG_08385 [Hirsutella rhossiliensis]KAH0960230.1 hypothetical protein HRG_08385 [Hirsutella rhossiliensis]